ncbi:MAG: pyridoxal-phosphate dependent enzyme [Nitrososphaerota archaeon]|nr:pyridoxal-phosphate dependent enzyme [Nitrososphaerales archaeon]MCX8192080.1 pyridoxal-phosphate dependent enzyme [Nitrososphaerales archaeon]MDW8044389.1 pyridoxal-phosphate dependent enzyme [Nitrososphaerota archaeon]
MNLDFYLSCVNCNKDYEINVKYWRCPSCNSPLEVDLEYPKIDRFSSIVDKHELTIWRYRLIPFSENKISLGEGLTPIIKHYEDGLEIDFKLEYMMPTGSFKDRGSAVSVARAKSVNVTRIVEDSSGNAGVSYSAYSAMAKLESRIYVPKDAPIAKIVLMKMCGTEVVECESREEASKRAVWELKENELYVGHTWDPFFIEGMKTEVYELFEFHNLDYDSIIVPVASGTHILGIYKGFKDLMNMGFIDHIPRLYAVQAGGCTPIYESYYNTRWAGEEGSLADGLRVKNPPRLKAIIKVVKDTDGDVVVVGNNEIMKALKHLYRLGFIVEPTSATAYAAFDRLKYKIGRRVLIPLTGNGMKTIDRFTSMFT